MQMSFAHTAQKSTKVAGTSLPGKCPQDLMSTIRELRKSGVRWQRQLLRQRRQVRLSGSRDRVRDGEGVARDEESRDGGTPRRQRVVHRHRLKRRLRVREARGGAHGDGAQQALGHVSDPAKIKKESPRESGRECVINPLVFGDTLPVTSLTSLTDVSYS